MHGKQYVCKTTPKYTLPHVLLFVNLYSYGWHNWQGKVQVVNVTFDIALHVEGGRGKDVRSRDHQIFSHPHATIFLTHGAAR